MTIPLKCGAAIRLEGGYDTNHYFAIKDTIRFSEEFGAGNVKQDQDLGFDGAYLKLQFGFGDISPPS